VVLAVVVEVELDVVWSHGGVGRVASAVVAAVLLEPEPATPALAS
jgi:hypothetical protein